MTEFNEYKPGTFCWVDLGTTDAAAAQEFYSSLFGWDFEAIPIDESNYYYMAYLDGKVVAGLGELSPEQQEQGIPPAWTSYVSVDDADASTETARSVGGTVFMEPMDVFEEGRMSLLADPTGAMFGVWQAGNHIGARLANVPGTLSWNELATRDPATAEAFYTEVFGWDAHTAEMEGGPYTSFMNGERAAGGMMEITEEWPADVPPHWLVYFAVSDCEASAAKVEELGGSVSVPPTSAGDVGTFAVIADPQGAVFSIIELNQPPD